MKEKSRLLLIFGASIFTYLTIVGFLYLIFEFCLIQILIITNVDAKINYYINEILYLVTFIFLMSIVFDWTKNNSPTDSQVLQILKISILSFVIIQVLQFLTTFYGLEYVLEHHSTTIIEYNDFAYKGKQLMISSSLDMLKYVVLGILIYRK